MEHILSFHYENRRNGARQRMETLRRYRTLRDCSNPFTDPNFRGIYRLSPDMALSLINDLRRYYPNTKLSNAIPVELKFLSALHFYAQGSYQKPDGRDFAFCLSQPSVCRAINQTTDALNRQPVLCRWIKFPCNSNAIESTIQKNYRNLKLPGVLGYIDGTHVLIKKPGHHEELYINRKGQHSMNVQVVCDSDLLILNIVAKYPGCSHDAFIWRASSVHDKMVQISATTSCWLLGNPVLTNTSLTLATRYGSNLHRYGVMAHNYVKELDPFDEVMVVRLKTPKIEMMLAPCREFSIIVVQHARLKGKNK